MPHDTNSQGKKMEAGVLDQNTRLVSWDFLGFYWQVDNFLKIITFPNLERSKQGGYPQHVWLFLFSLVTEE